MIIFLSYTSCILAQHKVDSALKYFSEINNQEKVQLMYDKVEYKNGERIYFKGIVFSGYELSNLSTNLNVELYNTNNEIVYKNVYPIINGFVEGSILLSDSLSESIYYLRAYTNLMLNDSRLFDYLNPIKVRNIKSNMIVELENEWDAFAEAEGGLLINGIESKIAVRFITNNQSPTHFAGYLVDSANPSNKILQFSPLDQNVALFKMIPKSGITYKIIVEKENGYAKSISLPNVIEKGAVINITQVDTLLNIAINFKNYAEGSSFKLIGLINNDLIYKLNFKKKDSMFLKTISTTNLSRGALHFTLFDEDENVLSERLSFLQPNSNLNVSLDSIITNAKPRGYNKFNLSLDSGYFYNLMVCNENNTADKNYLGYVWLNSDFKHYIQNASQYIKNDKEINERLDAIMISEKWERFNWKTLLNNLKHGLKYIDNNYLKFDGIVKYKNKPLKNEKINLVIFYPDSSRQIVQVVTDSVGIFTLNGLFFEGKAVVTYKFLNPKLIKELGSISFLNKTFVNNSSIYSLPKRNYIKILKSNNEENISFPKNATNEINNQSTLKDVIVKSKLISPTQVLVDKFVSGRYSYPRESYIDFVNQEQPNLELDVMSWLSGRTIDDDKNTKYYIDEREVNKDEVSTVVSRDVALIRLAGQLNKHFVFIYLKRGGELNYVGNPLNSCLIEGYIKTEKLVQPNYFFDTFNKKNIDNRYLLYWDSYINPLNNNTKKIEFYNNDHPTNKEIIIWGLNTEGLPFEFHKAIE